KRTVKAHDSVANKTAPKSDERNRERSPERSSQAEPRFRRCEVFCLPACLSTTYVQCQWRPEEGIKSPRTRITDSCMSQGKPLTKAC
ncbi:hypothetical protein LEMLEM_LOCUS13586, partial [Lemmus lemmus]